MPETPEEMERRVEQEEKIREHVRRRLAQQPAPRGPQEPAPAPRSPWSRAFWVTAAAVGALLAVLSLVTPRGGGSGEYDRYDFVAQCQELVRGQLRAPATARFPDLEVTFGPGPHAVRETSSGWEWSGYVDAENGFGALVRARFACVADASTRRVVARLLE